jgi:hypothetical protein
MPCSLAQFAKNLPSLSICWSLAPCASYSNSVWSLLGRTIMQPNILTQQCRLPISETVDGAVASSLTSVQDASRAYLHRPAPGRRNPSVGRMSPPSFRGSGSNACPTAVPTEMNGFHPNVSESVGISPSHAPCIRVKPLSLLITPVHDTVPFPGYGRALMSWPTFAAKSR